MGYLAWVLPVTIFETTPAKRELAADVTNEVLSNEPPYEVANSVIFFLASFSHLV